MKQILLNTKFLILLFLMSFFSFENANAICHTEFTYVAGSNPDSIIFTSHGTVAAQYLWNFGDGTTSTAASPSHVYAQPGVYQTCITIVTSTGDSCDWCGPVEVHAPVHTCHVEFTYVAGTNPDSIIFTPSVTAALQYIWHFGDGTTSTSASPSHVYAQPGVYQTCLIIVTATGDSCDWCGPVEVHAPVHTCHTEFNYTAGTNPDSIIFTTSGTAAVQYIWNFGDGTTSNAPSPSHVYAQPGVYHACLIIVTATGDSCDFCRNVEVHAPVHNCHTEFTFVVHDNPDSITFTAHGTAAVQYLWDFGDGTTSTAANPTHVFSAGGPFSVCLTIVTATGDSCDWCHWIATSPQQMPHPTISVINNTSVKHAMIRLRNVRGSSEIVIINSFGRIVRSFYSGGDGDYELPTEGLLPGIYFLTFSSEGYQQKGQKLIVY